MSRLRLGRGSGGVIVLLVAAIVFLLVDESERGGSPAVPGESSGGPERAGGSARAEVLRIVDGDTIEVELDGRTEDIRYIGVDTPESVKPNSPVDCFGPEASEFNGDLVAGKRVRLVFDRELRDRFGRLLAYVYVGDSFINAELVRGGYARTLEIEPNTAEADLLAELEAAASAAGRGLWSNC